MNMKKIVKKWFLTFLAFVMTLSLWGCGNPEAGELAVEILDEVVDILLEADSGEPVQTSEEDSGKTADTTDDNSFEISATPTIELTVIPEPTATPEPTSTPTPKPTATPTPEPAIDEDGWYYSKEDVALYLYTYGQLPENFITKSEAQDLGWSGGSVERYKEGAAIGGDKFGNREGILPKKSGRQYYECDIDTDGASSRGAKRIVFSNDGLIYYTEDHYETFTLLYGSE